LTLVYLHVILQQSKPNNFNMLMDFFKGLNWIDIFLAGIFVRVVFIGIKKGFVVEFFKCLGIFFAIFLTLHYYSLVANLLASQLSVFEPTAVRIFVFLAFWCLIVFAFKLIRDGMMALFSVQPHPYIDKWVAAALATVRGLLVCSMTFFVLLLSLNPVILKLSESSFSKFVVGHLAGDVYSGFYWGAVIKFFPQEPMNAEVVAVPKLIENKKK
jgi:uncharacterized membrane protein required for colicin V production